MTVPDTDTQELTQT